MSGILNGSDMVLYAGGDLRVIGCESTCTFSMQAEEINTTTKGSGRGTNREYGSYDWQVVSNGVIFIQDTLPGSTKVDPFEFSDYIILGRKIYVKFKITVGSVEKIYFGQGIVSSCEYAGSADSLATYSVTIKADGPIYKTDNLALTGGGNIIVLDSSFFGAGYASFPLYQKTIVAIFVDDVLTTGYTFNNNAFFEGEIDFTPDIAAGKTIEVIYR